MTDAAESQGCELIGLDGGNPIGFLAALGTFRTLSSALPASELRLSWANKGVWRPVLRANARLDRADLLQRLDTRLRAMRSHPAFALGDNLEVPPAEFRSFAENAAESASASNRIWTDFASAFACEVTTAEKNGKVVVQDTDFRTMSGSGHQHFLKFLRNIVDRTDASHLNKTLFEPWRYDDPVENQTMRWDPVDDQRYALRWRNPSGDPLRRQKGTMLGANRLAIEALPMFPTAPKHGELCTTGFKGKTSRDCQWTWPIWQGEASLDVTKSLLSLPQLQQLVEGEAVADSRQTIRQNRARQELRALGIVAVFRSRRLTLGKFRNFTPAHAI